MPFRSGKRRSGVGISGSTGQSNTKRVGRAGKVRSGGGRMRGSESHEVPPFPEAVLGIPVISAIAATTVTATTPTNTISGTFYFVVSENPALPTPTQIKAGTDAGDVAGVDSGNGAVAANPIVTAVTGLTASTAYYFFAYQENTNPAVPEVVSSGLFTTIA